MSLQKSTNESNEGNKTIWHFVLSVVILCFTTLGVLATFNMTSRHFNFKNTTSILLYSNECSDCKALGDSIGPVSKNPIRVDYEVNLNSNKQKTDLRNELKLTPREEECLETPSILVLNKKDQKWKIDKIIQLSGSDFICEKK